MSAQFSIFLLWDRFYRWCYRGLLITTRMIRCEYARTHSDGTDLQAQFNTCMLDALDFPVSDLKLSLDDFSRKQGWIK